MNTVLTHSPAAVAATVHSTEDLGLQEMAVRLEGALPALNRQLFVTDHPLADLPVAQLRLCSLLLREGRRTMSQIGDELGISVSAVTQMADRLEKAGMVERVAEAGGDRRTRHLQLTPRGDELMRSRRDMRTDRAKEVLCRLTPEKQANLMAALNDLLDACNSLGPPASAAQVDAPWSREG